MAGRAAPTDYDVLIVGAGISGIGMAAHMEEKAPHHSYAILERRADLGGTWDLFRYPGIRSDSDMHTLGFDFEPWKHEKTIADGPAILDYLNRIVDERGIREHIRTGHTVLAADWREAHACWHVTVETAEGDRKRLTANWLYLGSGYYDYDEAYDPGFDLGAFEGRVVHPQFWPDDLDYAGKQVVVIGSGATAVTLVPSMAKGARGAAKVTMLQRTPTWMFSRPAKDRIANFLRKVLPEKLAYRVTRWKNITLQHLGFKRPYDPWDQRLCLIPDDDLFEAMKKGRAEIVTGHIAAFEQGGVRLKDDRHLPADIVVTATGLKLAVAGKIAISQNGEPVDLAERFYYKGCMFSNLPNLAVVFGYLNASWTLRSDINADFICRVLERMRATGATIAEPVLPADHDLVEDDIFDFSSGYIQRSKHLMPKNAVAYPWRLNQEYVTDRKRMASDSIEDGVLDLRRADGQDASSQEGRLEPAG